MTDQVTEKGKTMTTTDLGTIEEHVEGHVPTLSLSHLPARSNQRDESYYYSPFGTHVLLDLSYPKETPDRWSVSFTSGAWGEDCWHQKLSYRPEPMAEGVTLKDACRIILEDILRRYRETPPIVDPDPDL